MSTASLSGLLIEHLRGSVEPFRLPFEKSKKLTIVYGENGTGKSTIADAFDLLGNGRVGSLDTRGLGVTRGYWHSVGKTPADIKVTLETSAGNCSVSLGKNDVVVSDLTLRPPVAVLRRNQILQLIEAKPADRYNAIRKFVDVSGVEASEASLRGLIRAKEGEFNTSTTRVAENRSEIERFWVQAGSPERGAIAWARQEVQKDQGHLDARKEAIDRLIRLWDALVGHPQKVSDLSDRLQAAEAAQQEAEKALDALKDAAVTDNLEVLELLKAAQTHFRQHPGPTVCPLCESGENVAGLVAEVDRRIQSQGLHGKLEAAKRLVETKADTVRAAAQRLEDSRNAAAADASTFETYCAGGAVPADLEMPAPLLPADFVLWESWIATHSDKRNQWRQAADDCVSNRKFLDTLRTSLEALDVNEDSAKQLEALVPRLTETLRIVEQERKKFTDNMLSAISSRVGELYEMIHPGEGLNKIVLALDAAKRASLQIAAEFCGKPDAPPQAYFSDSHLDTLGLCVFLALAERDEPEIKLLVLDDVLGSVDEPHVDRIIEMLYDATAKFRHCVITTHYGPWRHKYRWGWLKNGQCQFVELSHWSLQKGMSHSKSIPEVERLRTLLQDAVPDYQTICGKSGVILEAILDFLTQLYECSVPRRSGGKFTLGDLLPAIKGKLLKALRVEHMCVDAAGVVTYLSRNLEQHLVELDRIAQVRNVTGCHFNALSFNLLDSDAIGFGTEVLALADALIDPDSGWPRNGKSGSYWATAGETRRLHPLKKPS